MQHIKLTCSVLMFMCVLIAGSNLYLAASADQPNLISELSTALGFTKNQVFDASISDNSTLKLSVDECSFCGAFKNEDTRNRIARASLEWLLSKTGGKTGTVEWYNRSRVKIMTISGSREQSEITSGLPCAIKKQ